MVNIKRRNGRINYNNQYLNMKNLLILILSAIIFSPFCKAIAEDFDLVKFKSMGGGYKNGYFYFNDIKLQVDPTDRYTVSWEDDKKIISEKEEKELLDRLVEYLSVKKSPNQKFTLIRYGAKKYSYFFIYDHIENKNLKLATKLPGWKTSSRWLTNELFAASAGPYDYVYKVGDYKKPFYQGFIKHYFEEIDLLIKGNGNKPGLHLTHIYRDRNFKEELPNSSSRKAYSSGYKIIGTKLYIRYKSIEYPPKEDVIKEWEPKVLKDNTKDFEYNWGEGN